MNPIQFNTKMTMYYKYITNFLKKSDPNKMIKGEYLECGTNVPPYNFKENEGLRRLVMNPWLPYSMEAFEYQEENPEIKRIQHIVAGLYFPNAQPGTKVKIVVGRSVISEIVITNSNKIYLPIDNQIMLYILNLQFHQVNVIYPQANKFYIFGVHLRPPEDLYLVRHGHSFHIYNKNLYWLVYGGMGIITKEINNSPYNIISKAHLDYHANKIKKYFKKCKKIKNKQKWTLVGQEIKALPERGVDYFAGKERFEQLKLK